VHQTYNLPLGYERISGSFYSGNSWTTLIDYQRDSKGKILYDEDGDPIYDHSPAIKRGVTTAYGTTNEYEDFAELVSNYITTDSKEFSDLYTPISEAAIQEEFLKVYNTIIADKFNPDLAQIKMEAVYKALNEGKSFPEAMAAGEQAVHEYAIKKSVEKSEEMKALNAGKTMIMEKLEITFDYYRTNFDVDLKNLRDIVQERIVNAQKEEE
jgi:hypothetical protein